MMKQLRVFLLLTLTALTPLSGASAQSGVALTAGPRLDVTAVALRDPAPDSGSVAQVRRQNSVGRPMALMVVGGAALILGLVIGDDVGTLFSIGGAIAFLYGLYLYLR